MAIEKVMLGDGHSIIEIVNHGGINFSLFKPSIGCLRSKGDSIFIRKTSLPATKW
jgi:hypothetical protein